jgi:hypothetical protein
MYEATRASFDELFPRLAPGGLYVIEDWRWPHVKLYADMWVDRVPLSRLILELVLASACAQSLIAEITIDEDAVVLTRGNAIVDPLEFDILDRLDRRAQSLLAEDERLADGVRAPAPD